VDEAADPDHRPELVEHGPEHQRAAALEPAHRVGEPCRVRHEEHAEADRHRPPPRRRRAPDPKYRREQEQSEREAAQSGQAELGGEKQGERPAARLVGQRPRMHDQQEQRGGARRHQRAGPDQGQGACPRGDREAARPGRWAEDEQDVREAADGGGQAHRPETAQQDVEEPGQQCHALSRGTDREPQRALGDMTVDGEHAIAEHVHAGRERPEGDHDPIRRARVVALGERHRGGRLISGGQRDPREALLDLAVEPERHLSRGAIEHRVVDRRGFEHDRVG
jgi:hypothetical protein